MRRFLTLRILPCSVLLSLCACTTTPRAPVVLPPLPPVPTAEAPTPAECLRSHYTGFADHLGYLPADYESRDERGKAKALLTLKGADARAYRALLATALRCAPEK